MSERQEKLNRMQRQVTEGLLSGKAPAAKAAISRSWRDAVPELPVRFSVILVRTDPDAVAVVVSRMRRSRSRSVQLRLDRNKDGTAVQTVRGKNVTIGFLPGSDTRLLDDFGTDASLYRPQLLEVRYTDDGSLDFVSIELVRPELFCCPACERRHKGPHAYCGRCRKKGLEEEGFEHTPVQIHEAIDAVIADEADPDEELPI